MDPRRAGVALGALLALTALPAPALAGPPGKWTRVTSRGADVLDVMRPGLARTPDGVLHVSWTRRDTALAGSVLHSSVSANGRAVHGPEVIFTGPNGVNAQSVLVQTGGVLRAFFSASSQLDNALGTATSSDGGASWSVQPTPASRGGGEAKPVDTASGLAAALGRGGTVFSAWGASDPTGAGFHVGLSSADPDGSFAGGIVIDPGIGVDSQTGAAFAALNLLDENGVAVIPIAPGGPRVVIPNSAAAQLQHPVHVTGRIGAPGVYVAYTRGSSEFLGRAALWDVAARRGRVLGSKGDEDASVAPARGGRLWVFWRAGGEVRATRSNRSATKFGRTVSVPNPKGAESVFDLTGHGAAGPLDVLLQADAGGGAAGWHQRILPGLTIRATTGRGRLLLRVTDAGDPVRGARVKVSGEGEWITGRSGAATFGLSPGRYRASASKPGFAGAAVSVRVK